jgi:hypothetical protein
MTNYDHNHDQASCDKRLRAGAIAFGLAALMSVPSLHVLLLLDQVFAEPGWLPVFLGGLTYHIGLLVMSVAYGAQEYSRGGTAGLLAAAGLVGLATFMDVVALARVGAARWIAAFTAVAIDVWRNSRVP